MLGVGHKLHFPGRVEDHPHLILNKRVSLGNRAIYVKRATSALRGPKGGEGVNREIAYPLAANCHRKSSAGG
jgi:hypothetical protein